MADIERMTITLPTEMAAIVKGAVETGDYASSSEVVREALRDWKTKRALQLHELASLKADIDRGLADLAAGRVQDFDKARIIARGRKLLSTDFLPDWLDCHIWPQVQTMMLNDAYFKLVRRARELTGEFNGPIAGLIEVGYVTSQTLAIRRLCDDGRDVISLRRVLVEAKGKSLFPADRINRLSDRLNSCDHICGLVNNYVAHTANPLRWRNATEWNLQTEHMTKAQKAICEVAITLDRDMLQRKNYVKIIPVPQFDIMQEFRRWVSEADVKELWKFWHDHNDLVNAWL